ncbi:MAG: tRNA (N(6)-L-threonylcarbamoyladenosine(37)-C(2))-methylthiotransferase MtaB, partial [Aquificaceae bacterium]|nr:tRNA (N(6)-L-threonylcarbamoyladenosine(37)-C(2))-methylthiotransferase MtaB [Aquificaceae bacterium]
ENPDAIVVVTGCYAQISPGALAKLKEVDLIVGNSEKHRLVEILEDFLEGKGQRVYVENIFRSSRLESFDLVAYFEKARPFLKVQEGCNSFCTFCVIPFARGKVRSVPVERVVAQAKLLAERGFKEIVLTGTQLTQYGQDRGTSLYELLRELLKVREIELIRLSSLHPSEVREDLLELLLWEDRIAPHFHLSLQSGSDRILQLMERGYRVEDYRKLVERIVSTRPISAVGTDLIVGFPSEREEDFAQTCQLLEELPIAYAHIFPYSDRPFTKSSKMAHKVSPSVKRERVQRLKQIEAKKRELFRSANRGRELRAVVIEEGKLLTENYLELKGETQAPVGQLIRVKVE